MMIFFILHGTTVWTPAGRS